MGTVKSVVMLNTSMLEFCRWICHSHTIKLYKTCFEHIEHKHDTSVDIQHMHRVIGYHDSMDFMETVDSIHSLDAVQCIRGIHGVDSMESMESMDLVSTICGFPWKLLTDADAALVMLHLPRESRVNK